MGKPISDQEAKDKYGVFTQHEMMDNGQRRFRLKMKNGSAYIRTESDKLGAWQKGHSHKCVRETYIVQKGWIAYVESVGRRLPRLTFYDKGDLFTTKLRIKHNIFMPANSVVHTVKYGSARGKDWFKCPELDEVTERIPEKALRKLRKGGRQWVLSKKLLRVILSHTGTLIR
jgi:hypothetical protein